jgi:iron(III) transport system permease protein
MNTLALSALTISVALLTVSPVVAVLIGAFRDAPPGQPGTWTLDGLVRIVSDSQNLAVIWTSLWLALCRAILATALAIVIAWILARTDCPFRTQLIVLIGISFFTPILGKILGWTILASPRTGYLNQLLRLLPWFPGASGPIDIYSYGGVIFVSILGWSTFLILFLLPSFSAMDASLEEAGTMSGASQWRVVQWIMIPLMRPAIVAVFVLALARMFSSFEVEYFLGSRAGIYVFTNKIYASLDRYPADYNLAFGLVFVLLIITASLVAMNWILVGQRNYTTVSGRSYSARVMSLGRWRWAAFALVFGYVFVSLILPLTVIIQTSFTSRFGSDLFSLSGYSLERWERLFALELPRRAIVNSIVMGVVAATVGMIIYTVVAYVVARTDYPGRRLLDMAAWVPWAVPTLALGIGILWTVAFTPLAFLYGSLALLIVAQIIRGFPAQTRIMTASVMQIGQELEEAARVHGASWWTTFRQIWLPLLRNGFIAGWIIEFTVSFSDLALVAFLYGPDSTVLPTLFLSLWRASEWEMASAAALVNTAIVLIVVLIARSIGRIGIGRTAA